MLNTTGYIDNNHCVLPPLRLRNLGNSNSELHKISGIEYFEIYQDVFKTPKLIS